MRRPVGLVMTFGLARTPAQAGMLEVLTRQGIEAQHVSATSLGAINAAAHAAGRSTTEIRGFWLWMHDEILGSPLKAIARNVGSKKSAKQVALVRARLEALLPATFEELELPLSLVATDLRRGNAAVFESGDLLPAVMASCALPGLFPPVEIAGRYYIDGGLVAGMPLSAFADRVGTAIVLDVGHSATTAEIASEYRWWEVGSLAYSHQIREQAVNALHLVARRKPVVMVSTAAGRLLDFGDPQAMIEAGEVCAREALEQLPSRLRAGIYGLPDGLDEYSVLQGLAVDVDPKG
jgi:NTE family protein